MPASWTEDTTTYWIDSLNAELVLKDGKLNYKTSTTTTEILANKSIYWIGWASIWEQKIYGHVSILTPGGSGSFEDRHFIYHIETGTTELLEFDYWSDPVEVTATDGTDTDAMWTAFFYDGWYWAFDSLMEHQTLSINGIPLPLILQGGAIKAFKFGDNYILVVASTDYHYMTGKVTIYQFRK